MTPEQTLIQQITRMIENGLLERNALLEEYAVQYAELCGSVNARLLQCANYLEKGLLSEAMYIAGQSPDLLEAVELVQFPLAKKWENICIDLELTMPPLLHTEIVAKLQKASAREQALRPLLQEFRKYTYQREHRPALEVLRKIRSIDPENQSWAENLRLLEEEELPRWLERLEKALSQNNLPELKLIEAELCHPQRVAPVPEEALKRLSASLLQEHREELFQEASALMEEMRLHLGAASEKGVRSLLEKVRLLEQNQAFLSRPENWQRMKDEAEAFLASAREKQKALQQHQEEEKAFQHQLEAGRASDLELRQAMQRLEKSGFPVSDLLKRQMEEMIAERHRLRLVKLRSSFGIVLVAVLLILGAGGTWFYLGHRSRLSRKRLEQIGALIQQREYQQAEQFLNAFKQEYPDRIQEREILKLTSELEKAQRKVAENQRLKETLRGEMKRAQKEGFNISDAQAAAWMNRAALLTWTPEEKITLDSWQSAWLREKKDRLQNSNAMVRQAVQKAVNFLAYHQTDEPDQDFLKQIGALQEELRLVRSQALHVEEGLRLALEQQLDSLGAREKELQRKLQGDTVLKQKQLERQAAREKLQQRLRSFIRPEDLSLYFAKLAQLIELGGSETAELYGRILEQKEQQNSAFLMNQFQFIQVPLNQKNAVGLQKQFGSLGRNTVWTSDVNSLLENYRRQKEVRDALPGVMLEQQEQYLLYRLEYRKKGTVEWRPLYMPEMLNHREEMAVKTGVRSARDGEKIRYTLYWGKVYFWENDEDEPMLMHSSKVFPGGLNTLDYDIRHFSPRKEEQLCPHGRFLIQLVADSAGVKDAGVFLLQKLKEAERAPGLEVIPRFWLKQRIVYFLSERVYPGNRSLKALAQQYSRYDVRVPWMNRRHPGTLKLEKKLLAAGSMLPDIDGLLRSIALENSLVQRSLTVAPRCVGVLLPGENGVLKLAAAPAAGQELRVMVSSRAVPGGAVWLQLSADGKSMNPEVLRSCLPGQPVFAVRESCQSWLRKNIAVSEEEWHGIQHRPGSWPENAWTYPGRQD